MHRVALVGFADRVERAAIQPAAGPKQIILAGEIPLKTNQVYQFSRLRVSNRIHHVVRAQRVGHLGIQVLPHQIHHAGFVVRGVPALAVGIEPFHLAGRASARSPQKQNRLAGAVGILDGCQSANAADIGIDVVSQTQ